MPRTSDETLGRRRFQLSRDLAVEAAIEKIRRAPLARWHTFSHADYVLLKELLGEIWIVMERERWDRYSFSTLTSQDLIQLLALGRQVRDHIITGAMADAMDAILSQSRDRRGVQ